MHYKIEALRCAEYHFLANTTPAANVGAQTRESEGPCSIEIIWYVGWVTTVP